MTKFDLKLMPGAERQLIQLRDEKSKKAIFKAVSKALNFMQTNLRHPSLNTHKYSDKDKKVKKFSSHMLKIIYLVHIEFFGFMDQIKLKLQF